MRILRRTLLAATLLFTLPLAITAQRRETSIGFLLSLIIAFVYFIFIIASKARFPSAPPAPSASINTRGVICQEMPQRSLHHPHWLSAPPFPTIAFQ